MKILIVSTTTHKDKSTSKMVLSHLSDILNKDHDIDFVDANDLHIVPNLSCYSDGGKNCASPDAGKYRCWAHKLSHENPDDYKGKDEMGILYDALEWCDLVIWGTSVRWGSHSALMQKIIERMNTLENQQTVYGEKNPLKGKKAGVVVTGQHYKAPQVAEHLITQFGWFGFDTDQSYVLSWQKSQDIHLEQEDDNNDPLETYLKSKEGKAQVENFLSFMELK
jgi:multimeric flavodoxin WrbA